MASHNKPIVWTIAGSDSGGGAGIQADLATFHDFGVHGCSVITAVTAQNSFAVGHVSITPRRALAAQINALDSDLPAKVIKLGMMASEEIVEMVIKYLQGYTGFVVCDPVIKSSSGASLLSGKAGALVRDQLLPLVNLVTPNRDEAAALLGRDIDGLEDVERAAADIVALGVESVLITGGHFSALAGERLDYWSNGVDGFWLRGPSVDTVNSHGTGCTLSSAVAAALARGYVLADALVLAKAYVTQGLRQSFQLGGGPGSVAHAGWPRCLEDYPRLSRSLAAATGPAFPDCGGELGLYPVVDSVEWIKRLLPLGVTTLQLRIKGSDEAVLREAIREANRLCREQDVRLFINDHWQLAIEAGTYGIHLGQEDLDRADLGAIAAAGLRLGISTHSHYEIARARNFQPSYIALGPIYATTSKDMTFAPRGLGQLRHWVELLGSDYTLTAIGGINEERVADVLATGVGSCAMISAITESADYPATVKRLLAIHASALGQTSEV